VRWMDFSTDYSAMINPLAYMSGHYGMFGLNCQAVYDARERFLFFGVVAPGKTNDSVAFEY
jgi:hypothetical protein